jgi:tetratricopeptide (TPR) repeat protein/transcriptional regulator with XRE-family HTH domain
MIEAGHVGEDDDFGDIVDVADLAAALRRLKRRQARDARDTELTVRELAAKTGYAVGAISAYLSGATLPPTDRFDVLAQVLGATEAELRALATARDRVTERRTQRRRRQAQLPDIANVPFRNQRFVGREAELTRLAHGAGVQVLHGMGGVGKTHLAIEHVHRQGGRFDVVWLVEAALPTLIPGQLATLATRLGLADVDESAATTALVLGELSARRSCLIFDDAAEPEALLGFLPRHGHVVITTRSAAFGALGEVIEVDLLARSESVDLVLSRLPWISRSDADELAELLGDLPIAIEQASAYLDLTACPFAEYRAALADQAERLLDRGRVVGHKHTLANLWAMSIQRIAAERPDAMSLLILCSFLDGAPIPLELFETGREQLPAALAVRLDHPIDFADTVGVLVGLALARRNDDCLTVHRMVQAAVRGHIGKNNADDHTAPAHTIARLMAMLRQGAPEEIWNEPAAMLRWRRYMPHILTVLRRHRDADVGASDACWLLDHAGTYLHAAGQAEGAIQLLRSAVHLADRIGETDRLPVMASRLRLAIALRDGGEFAEAEAEYRTVLEHHEARFGPTSTQVADVLSELGAVRLYQGEYDEAELFMRRALELRCERWGPDHTDTYGSENDLACLHIMRGELGPAEVLLRRVCGGWLRLYGQDNRRTLNALNNLAIVLRDQGRLAEAEKLTRQLLQARMRMHGAGHPNSLAAKSNLALVFQARGRYAAAQRLLREVAAANQELHGPDHPHTLAAWHRIGTVLRDEGDLTEARRIFERVLAARERVLGPQHPDSVASRAAVEEIALP